MIARLSMRVWTHNNQVLSTLIMPIFNADGIEHLETLIRKGEIHADRGTRGCI